MRLEILAVCPGTEWVPGQTVDATPQQANQWADGLHARVIRDAPYEQATTRGRQK